ncbi:MAG: flagellar protein FliS, partial [Firmicutes bacterium]|nr:flagellar protein FliS [Bacillota bacterium]
MDKNRQKDFARRISQANRTELVVVTYDIILEETNAAKKALAADDINGYRTALKSAQRFLCELMSVLDYK